MLHVRKSRKNSSAKHVLASLGVATSTDDIADFPFGFAPEDCSCYRTINMHVYIHMYI